MTRPQPGDEPAGETPSRAESAAGSSEDAAAATAREDALSDGDSPPGDRLEALTAELEQLRAAHARAVADYQNLRRRSTEERSEQARLLMKTLVLNYLPVLDDLNRALDSVKEYEALIDHPWVEGIRMVQRKFWGVLQASGVAEIEASAGSPFNPELQEAVANQPGPLNEVTALVQSGYVIGETVIRPAMVIVGNGETPPTTAAEPRAGDRSEAEHDSDPEQSNDSLRGSE